MFNLILSSIEDCFYDYKINFNSTVILSQISTVSALFLLKMCLSHGQFQGVISDLYRRLTKMKYCIFLAFPR